ncbi:hypothetical protein E2C01_093796 [Portunus trituberculatus]|uniref:Uncharacterized protein n=1 Tax=Portunus trituberculatus TaxID=210409 RepID=A0A5B7JV59_PORTR|nr:hypothetical protein [Portunus trituberculatus]
MWLKQDGVEQEGRTHGPPCLLQVAEVRRGRGRLVKCFLSVLENSVLSVGVTLVLLPHAVVNGSVVERASLSWVGAARWAAEVTWRRSNMVWVATETSYE